MASLQPAPPVNRTGLPPGVQVGGLGTRFLAYLIDRLVPALLAAAAVFLGPLVGGDVGFGIQVASGVLTLAWVLFVWWGLAVRAAGPGMRLVRLQLVGFYDGRPTGWIRVFLRALVLAALSATGIGLLLLLIFLVIHPRKQGWHDLLVHAVVIKQRALAPRKSKVATEQRRPPEAITPAQQGQHAGTQASGGQPHPSPQPLAPPAGVGGYSPVPGPAGPVPGAAQPYGEPSVAAVPTAQPSGQPPFPTGESDQFGRPQPAGESDQLGRPQPAGESDQLGRPQPAGESDQLGRPQPAGEAAPPQPLTPPAGLVPPPMMSAAASAAAANHHAHPGGENAGGERDRPAPSEAGAATGVPPSVAVPESSRTDGQTGWFAVLDDGREIDVTGLVLLGRNPHAQPGEEDAQLIKIADETRTVSKSHLAIATDSDGPFVVDRGSTNGSTVTTRGGVSTKCRMGERVRVSEGTIVSIGDHWLEIRRRTD